MFHVIASITAPKMPFLLWRDCAILTLPWPCSPFSANQVSVSAVPFCHALWDFSLHAQLQCFLVCVQHSALPAHRECRVRAPQVGCCTWGLLEEPHQETHLLLDSRACLNAVIQPYFSHTGLLSSFPGRLCFSNVFIWTVLSWDLQDGNKVQKERNLEQSLPNRTLSVWVFLSLAWTWKAHGL